MRPANGRRPASSRVEHPIGATLVLLIAAIVFFASASTAEAALITNWYGTQPKGTTGTNVPIVVQGRAAWDGFPLVSSTGKLYVDGVEIPRSSYTASILNSTLYYYYQPPTKLTDGGHTFRAVVNDTRGVISTYQWTASIAQPPTATWVSPAAGRTLYGGLPAIAMTLADNTPDTTFSVTGQIRSGTAAGPVAATFGGSGLPAGRASFAPAQELAPGVYYLTATVRDAAGNTLLVQGASARSFATVALPAMTIIETCEACHATYRTAHPTPSAVDCVVCHPGNDGDHMEGTDYCEDCHWDGWHADGARTAVTVASPCTSCHGPDRGNVERHTAASAGGAHASSCDGCHTTSLVTQHATTAAGSSYPNQCDLCHASSNARVAAAIAAGETTCSACHDAEPGHGFDPADHTAAIQAESLSGTWSYVDTATAVSGTLMNVPYAYDDVMCLDCHTSVIGGQGGEHGKPASSTAAAGCAACHPTPVTDGGMTRPWDKTCYACHAASTVHTAAGLAARHSLVDSDPADEGSCGFVSPANGRRPCHYSDIVQEHNRLISPQVGLPNTVLSVTCAECHDSPISIAALANGWDGTCADCHDGVALPNHSVAGTARADAVYALHANTGGYYDNGDGFSGSNAMDAHGPVRQNPDTWEANKTIGCGAPTCHTSAATGGGFPFGAGTACGGCHGPNQARIAPFEGAYSWDSGTLADGSALQSDLTITLAEALPPASSLDFKTVYDIEEGWDYGYVKVSTDDGATWTNLASSITTAADPNGMNLGNGITGGNGGWRDAHFDLSAYAGQSVKVRLSYVTDAYVYGAGWKVDLITIGPAGSAIFSDDAETANAEMVVESRRGTVPATDIGWKRYTTP